MNFFRKQRRRLRSWRNTIRLKRESDFYLSAFKKKNLAIPHEKNIQAAIKTKFPGLMPKQKGALKILSLYHHYNWEKESLHPSLNKFGPVWHYDWADASAGGGSGGKAGVWQTMNDTLVGQVTHLAKKHKPDVIFAYISGEILSVASARNLAALKIPSINLSLNDKEAFVGKIRNGQSTGVRDICRYFDVSWTSTLDATEKYVVEGACPVYLPEGANPEVHKPSPLERDIDVSFVGMCYGQRPTIIDTLMKAGIQVVAYGAGWPNGPLSLEDMVRLYSRSKINLGFGGVAGYQNTCCLKGRDFEVPMSGGLYLTEYCDELSRFYKPGEEIVVYSGLEDLIEKTRYFLSHPDEAQKIRENALARARSEHTWEMRFEKIFRMMGLI